MVWVHLRRSPLFCPQFLLPPWHQFPGLKLCLMGPCHLEKTLIWFKHTLLLRSSYLLTCSFDSLEGRESQSQKRGPRWWIQNLQYGFVGLEELEAKVESTMDSVISKISSHSASLDITWISPNRFKCPAREHGGIVGVCLNHSLSMIVFL